MNELKLNQKKEHTPLTATTYDNDIDDDQKIKKCLPKIKTERKTSQFCLFLKEKFLPLYLCVMKLKLKLNPNKLSNRNDVDRSVDWIGLVWFVRLVKWKFFQSGPRLYVSNGRSFSDY